MPEITDIVILGGKAELAIGNVVIPPEMLGDIKVSFKEGSRESKSLAGVRKKPSGTYETAEVKTTILLPSMDYLKTFWAGAYKQPTNVKQKTGHVIFGSNTCSSRTPLPINIHYTCQKTDDNDIHIFAGLIDMSLDLEYNESDDLKFELMIYAQPTSNGYVRFGTGDLDKPSKYDASTQKTVEVTG